MSLSRIGEGGEWYDVTPGYVYMTSGKFTEYEFNTPIRTPIHFSELAMRALDQSGELDDETLEECQQAFAKRFDLDPPELED